VSRREIIQDDDAVSGGNQSIRTYSADIPGPTGDQDCAWIDRHSESLRDGIRSLACNDALAPCKQVTLGIRHAAMGDVIDESRKECGDPRTWRATEASHQLIPREGKIARRGGELLLITLHARVEKCGGGTTSSTGSNAATNLSRGIAWVTRGSGGHDSEGCPIKVAALRLTLRDFYRAVQRSDLLDRGNGGARSAPRFKECRDIIVVGDRQKELAHAPQGIWRIGERIATDRLNARTNRSAPFRGKRGCDGGKDAEICSKLQGACWAHSGKDPLNLCANSLAREACSQRGIALDCRGGICLHRQVEARNKPECAQHAQRIFSKPFGRITNGAQ
jgi:hypothetical protein